MSLILSGTDGLSDVDGTAATPAIRGTDANTGIFFPAADTIAFAEGGAEVARFDSAGNLGLGVTPSANTVSGSGYRQIEVGTTVGNMIFAGGNELYVSQNVIYNSGWKYAVSVPASQYRLNGGGHQFYTAPTGTAGNTATFTQAMTLDANGSLVVGGTTVVTNNGGITATTTSSGSVAATLGMRNAGTANGSGTTLVFRGVSNASAEHDYAYVAGVADDTTAKTGSIRFSTTAGSSPVERARITSSGYFKASDTGTYHSATGGYHEFVNSAADNLIKFRNSNASNPYGFPIAYSAAAPNGTANQFWDCSDTGGLRAEIRSNGGLANYSANNVNLSDRREKTNFAPATSYLNKVCAIPVQTFNYIDQNLEQDGGLTLGVVAQDVQAVAPELVMESNWANKDEEPKMRLSIYQTDLQYALMKCIQEQQALITALTARITALESA